LVLVLYGCGVNSASLQKIDWLDPAAVPVRWQDALKPMVFMVPCSGDGHMVRWTPEQGAVAAAHDVADRVVGALGGDVPVCLRLVELMNAGLLAGAHTADGAPLVVPRWDARDRFHDSDEAARFAAALADLTNPLGVVLRGSPTRALQAVVRDAFVTWLRSLGLPFDDHLEIRVEVSSRLPSGRYGNLDKVVLDDLTSERPLVGLQMCVSAGARTRAVVCVTDSWLEEASVAGVARNGRFLLGDNGDGPVYSHLETPYEDVPARSMVAGWGVLDEGDLVPQDFAGLREAASMPVQPDTDDVVYVGAFTGWSDRGATYMAEEGVHPACVLRNVRDAESWHLINHFIESYVNMEDFRAYAPAPDMEVPEGFDLNVHGPRDLLAMVVRGGWNPFYYGLPMAQISAVPDLR
jgi:hypothetical protein